MMTDSSMDSILASACRQVGLPYEDTRLLHAHSTAVFVLNRGRTVARVSSLGRHGLRAASSVKVAKWLLQHEIPVTEPLIDYAVEAHGTVVTFWRYYPQPDRTRPPIRELGRILSALHATPPPPFALPTYAPLAGLTQVLDTEPGVLAAADRQWLIDRTADLIDRYHRLESVLGCGLVHGDAYPGNTLWSGDRVLLCDWDEASIAPRELDLINTYQGTRFGRSDIDLDEFGRAYGWDVRQWPGFAVLREMRDLHTLTSYIRRAAHGDTPAAIELQRRIRSLRDPTGIDIRWHAVA